jgi:hypothetical protein
MRPERSSVQVMISSPATRAAMAYFEGTICPFSLARRIGRGGAMIR